MLKSNLVSVLSDWMVEEGRQAGDTTYIAAGNDAGFYVAMYLDSRDNSNVETVNVRHILISTSENVTAEDAKKQIEDLKTEFESNPTEEHFAELAQQKSSDTGSSANGGLYENVAPGQMVEAFNDWIFDTSRKAGDVGIVETDYGCHLMYFVGPGKYSFRDSLIVNAKTNADYEAWYTGLTEALTPPAESECSWPTLALRSSPTPAPDNPITTGLHVGATARRRQIGPSCSSPLLL